MPWRWGSGQYTSIFDGEEHPIIYISCKLMLAEQHYTVIEQEALAIKWAVEELNHYVTSCHFNLVTDHSPLQWLAQHKDTTNSKITFCRVSCFRLCIVWEPSMPMPMPSPAATRPVWSSGGTAAAPLLHLMLATIPHQSAAAGNPEGAET